MAKFDPTREQTDAVEAFRTGDDLVLEAGAGTGKTSTLKLLANVAEDRGIYLAYNRSVAQEAGTGFPPHVLPKTAHSLAFGAYGHAYRDRLDADRVPLKEAAHFLKIRRPFITEDLTTGATRRLSQNTMARLAMEMVDRFCQSADPEITLRHVPYVEGVDNLDDLAAELLPYARDAWKDLQLKVRGRLRFTHDHYLKMWQLSGPVLPATFVLFDEAQDANPCIAAIVAAQDCQKIYVGDRAQAIYGWRGAIDAMDIPGVPRLQLSQSFRFGPAIATEANRWLERLDTGLRLSGTPAIDSSITEAPIGAVTWPRAILCRTNATAFDTLLRGQEAGVRIHLQGGGREILSFCRGAEDLKDRGWSAHRDLSAFTTWQDVQDYVGEDKSAADLKVLVNLVDRYGTERIVDAVQKMFPDEQLAQVTVSTAHKAKGREWSSVRIAPDFAERVDNDGQPRGLSTEDLMLRYVAVTRAQHELDRGPLAPGYRPAEEL